MVQNTNPCMRGHVLLCQRSFLLFYHSEKKSIKHFSLNLNMNISQWNWFAIYNANWSTRTFCKDKRWGEQSELWFFCIKLITFYFVGYSNETSLWHRCSNKRKNRQFSTFAVPQLKHACLLLIVHKLEHICFKLILQY